MMSDKERLAEIRGFFKCCYMALEDCHPDEIAVAAGVSVSTVKRLSDSQNVSLRTTVKSLQGLGHAAGISFLYKNGRYWFDLCKPGVKRLQVA